MFIADHGEYLDIFAARSLNIENQESILWKRSINADWYKWNSRKVECYDKKYLEAFDQQGQKDE